MAKEITSFVLLIGIFLFGCKDEVKGLPTRTVTIGENKCIVQQMPSKFQEGKNSDESKFDYFRIIIESKANLMDSSHVNYVNFGMENSIKKVSNADTVYPAFVQRIANGKKNNYEYIVSFEKKIADKNFEILIDDQVFEMGLISIKF